MIRLLFLLLFFPVLILFGGRNTLTPPLPDQPIAFESYSFHNPDNPDDGYMVIDYEGRTYVPYGTIGKTIHERDVDECLGYLVQDGEAMEDTVLCTLTADPEHHFLMEYHTEGIMEQPMFLRAADTAGQSIEIPDYIDSLEYEFWLE